MNFDWLHNLPTYQKLGALGLVVAIVIALFFYIFFIPKNSKISTLETEISKLQNEISVNETRARRLEELKKENAELERQLTEKKEQLPPEAEAANLLKQVSDLGLRVGLDFKLWKPGTKKNDPSGLFAEIPVNVEVAGGYHTTAMFFDRISKLSRIVNIGDLKMSSAKVEKGRVEIQTTFIATAFAALVEAPAKEAPADDKAKKRQPAAKPPAKPAAKHAGGGKDVE